MRALSFVLLSLLAGAVVGAEVYRSVDENGIVTFSDRPDGTNNERIVVDTQPATAAPAAPGARPASVPRVDGIEVGDEPPSEEALAEQRRRNCEIATERVERYRIARRLYRALPDGEREYLDEEQTAAARADAESDLATWCG